MLNETYLFYATVTGLVLLIVAWIWLVILAFRRAWSWGFGVLLFPPLAIVFCCRPEREVRWPVRLLLVGVLLVAVPPLLNRLLPIDLGPYEKVVDGERHLTLTGWDQRRYDFLAGERDLVVLQMANADVTDATLQFLTGMDKLRELDLNNTAITDAGLAPLARLPALERLRLKNTKISDAGFREILSQAPALRELDLSGTAVTAESVAAWRKEKPGRRAMR